MKNNTLLAKLGFADKDRKSAQHDAAIHFVRQPAMLAQIDATFFPTNITDITEAYSTPEDSAHVTVDLKETYYATEQPITKGEGPYKQTIGFIDGCLHVTKSVIVTRGFQPIVFEVTVEELDKLKRGQLERYPNAFCVPDAVVQEQPVRFRGQAVVETSYNNHQYDAEIALGELYELVFSPRNYEAFSYYRDCSRPVLHGATRADSIRHWTGWVPGWVPVLNHTVWSKTMRWNMETKFHETSAADILRQVKLYREYDRERASWFALTFFDLSALEQNELSNADIAWIRMGGPRFDEWWKDQQRPAKQARLVF
jgi:hypothetical protein